MNTTRKGKKHGFEKPFTCQQIGIWIFYLFDIATFYGIQLLFYNTVEKVNFNYIVNGGLLVR